MVARLNTKLLLLLIAALLVVVITACQPKPTSLPQNATAIPVSSATSTAVNKVMPTSTRVPAATPTVVNPEKSPEEIEKMYLQFLVRREFKRAASLVSDYSLSLEGKSRQDIVSYFNKQDFRGWRILDYRIGRSYRLKDDVVLLDVMTKEKKGNNEPQSYDFLVALRKENGRWRINWGSIVDDMILKVEPQVVNSVSVQPVRAIRYTDKIVLVVRIQNNNQRGCFWGWAGAKVATFYFDESQLVDVPFDSPLKIDPKRTYPDAYVVVNGEFKTYPVAVDLVGWRFASKTFPDLPEPGETPWKYHFDLSYRSP